MSKKFCRDIENAKHRIEATRMKKKSFDRKRE